MSEKLKPCPFCGGQADIIRSANHWFFVRCPACEASKPGFETENDAVEAWNSRSSSAELDELDSANLVASLVQAKKNIQRLQSVIRDSKEILAGISERLLRD
jgi:Lar family restriction alleviation protein